MSTHRFVDFLKTAVARVITGFACFG